VEVVVVDTATIVGYAWWWRVVAEEAAVVDTRTEVLIPVVAQRSIR
jgi:hypothetical protein